MNLGFTGTRRGMTQAQYETVARLVKQMNPRWVHHGSALGADSQFHHICRVQRDRTGSPRIHLHPGPESPWLVGADVREDRLLYIQRNHNIVLRTDILIAAPKTRFHDKCRDGTCATIRYAMDLGRTITIVLPTGKPIGWATNPTDQALAEGRLPNSD